MRFCKSIPVVEIRGPSNPGRRLCSLNRELSLAGRRSFDAARLSPDGHAQRVISFASEPGSSSSFGFDAAGAGTCSCEGLLEPAATDSANAFNRVAETPCDCAERLAQPLGD